MKKEYDYYVTAQNTPHFKKRKSIMLAANSMLVLNLIIFSVLLSKIRGYMIGLAALFVIHSITTLLDKRREEWTWFSVIGNIVICMAISFFILCVFPLFKFFYILAAEVILLVVIIICLFWKVW